MKQPTLMGAQVDEDYGKKIYNLLVGVLVVAGVVGVFWWINRSNAQPAQDRTQSCVSRLNSLMEIERSDDVPLGRDMDAFGDECPAQYDIYVDYVQIKGSTKAMRVALARNTRVSASTLPPYDWRGKMASVTPNSGR